MRNDDDDEDDDDDDDGDGRFTANVIRAQALYCERTVIAWQQPVSITMSSSAGAFLRA